MEHEYRFPKGYLDNILFIRPDCPGAFLHPGDKGSTNYKPSLVALMCAGPVLVVKEEAFRDHFLN